jgi:hypothetical protein
MKPLISIVFRLFTTGAEYASFLPSGIRSLQYFSNCCVQILMHFAIDNRMPNVIAEIKWSYEKNIYSLNGGNYKILESVIILQVSQLVRR